MRTSPCPRGSRRERSTQHLLACVEQNTDRPRVRERQQRSLVAEAVGLKVALGGHSSARTEVAVLARDELPEAVEVLQRARAIRLARAPQHRPAEQGGSGGGRGRGGGGVGA